jgi:DNA end-binding protein Ku
MEAIMAPRAYWKGYLKLSLVSCPVALYPAVTSAEKTHFHQIDTRTGHRLRQQMVDEDSGKVVDKEHKGRGYELGKGRMVEVSDEELAAVQIESTHTIDIDTVVPRSEVDQRHLDRPYYIVPDDKSGQEAFAVIREAMREAGCVALGRIVIAQRERVVAIEPMGKGMLATTLHYPYELRAADTYFDDIPGVKIPKDMLKLAAHILDSKAGHFDPARFKDRYETALKELVRRKAAGKKIELPEREAPPSNVIDLMDALRRSVQGERAPSGGKRGGAKARKRAPSKRGSRKAA